MNEINPEYFGPPEKRKGSLGRKVGWVVFTLLVVAVCVAFIAPAFLDDGHHRGPGGGACKDNLRTIDGAIMQYRAGSTDYSTDPQDYVDYRLLKKWPVCPTDGDPYTIVPGNPPYARCPNGHTY